MPVINRHIINPNINYDGMNRDDLFILIDKWKFLLTQKYGAKKGQVLSLGIMTVNPNHIACLIATAELGMKLLMITKALSKETIHATKMGIFGPVDITIAEDYIRNFEDNNLEMFERYSKNICWESEIDDVTDFSPVDVNVEPEDIFLFSSTSGTTGESKPVYYSHGDLYQVVLRNIDAFKFKATDIIQHTLNMHHVSSIMHSLFPSLMVVNTHYYGYISGIDIGTKNMTPEYFVEEMWYKRGVNRILLNRDPWPLALDDEFVVDRPLIITICTGSTATERHYDFCKNNPVDLIFHYGSAEIGGPILIDYIDSSSTFTPDKLGIQQDDFYRVVLDNGAHVECDLWEGYKTLADNITFHDGAYYHHGRSNEGELDREIREQFGDFTVVNNILVLWDQKKPYETNSVIADLNYSFDKVVCLPKQQFIVETKVSMEQLRAYLEHHYAV
jgi:acyl-CoA synthetase (AMP-forming)/AMP-acid ligase II